MDNEDPAAKAARDQLLIDWREAKSAAAAAVAAERNLRSQVVALLFPTPVRGVNRYPLGNGYAMKLTHDIDYVIGDKELVDPDTREKIPVWVQIQHLEDELAGVNDGLLARLIKWTPELSPSEYRKLDIAFEDQRKLKEAIDAVLTTKDKAPTLELEEPKAK
jgi:hypothetical protein